MPTDRTRLALHLKPDTTNNRNGNQIQRGASQRHQTWSKSMTRSVLIAAAALSLFASGVSAAEYKAGNIVVTNAWARATPKGAQVGGAYMTIRNNGSTADRLVGGSSPVAGRLEMHEMKMDGGVMKMRPVTGGIEIKPGGSVELKPSGLHVMLVNLKQPLQQGQHVKATLEFEHAGKVEIEYQVEGMGAHGPAAPSMDHMGGH
jgi:copper(I)-binding protein